MIGTILCALGLHATESYWLCYGEYDAVRLICRRCEQSVQRVYSSTRPCRHH